MKRHCSQPVASALVVLGLSLMPHAPIAAQYSQQSLTKRFESGWENDRLRVRTISIPPGAQAQMATDVDRVVIYLTADVEGRMPQAEALWHAAGVGALQNRGHLRAEAIVVELKSVQARIAGTPPEALPNSGDVDTRVLIDNPRVTVTKHRYSPHAYAVGPWHFHPEDAVIVYLRGGHTLAPPVGRVRYHVRRGEIDIVPANTFHAFANAGSDPLEFLTIFPK
jgi:quercetin dioxygenase-like cupin family protein